MMSPKFRALALISLFAFAACDADFATPVIEAPAPPADTTSRATTVTTPGAFTGSALFLQIHTDAQRTASAWRASRPADAALLDKMARTPMGIWLGDWNSDVGAESRAVTTAAAASGAVPVFVLYNIPLRDCGLYSAGGATSAAAYRAWIQKIANGIGNRRAMVIIEPDGLASIDCLGAADRATRISLLREAVVTLKASGSVLVYMDAGNPHWNTVTETAALLREVGIESADGFALNVSNFVRTSDNVSYGSAVAARIGNKHFVIDTSRNGVGPAAGGEWCNPLGRASGEAPTLSTGNALIDAYLWIKPPGESDGPCNGGPAAGHWWPEYAVDLLKRGNY